MGMESSPEACESIEDFVVSIQMVFDILEDLMTRVVCAEASVDELYLREESGGVVNSPVVDLDGFEVCRRCACRSCNFTDRAVGGGTRVEGLFDECSRGLRGIIASRVSAEEERCG